MSNRKRKFKKSYVAAIVGVPLAVAVSVPQVRAQLPDSQDVSNALDTISDVTTVVNDAQNLFRDLTGFIKSLSFENLLTLGQTAFGLESIDNLSPEIVDFILNSAGSLASIREDVQSDIQEGILSGEITSGAFSTSGATAAQELSKAADRTQTNIHAQAHFSKDGQALLEQERIATVQLIEQIQQTAQRGQSDTVTQDVMKKLLAIQAQQTQVLGQSRMDSLRGRIDTQYTNINLANISQTLDEMAAGQRNQRSVSIEQIAQGGAQF